MSFHPVELFKEAQYNPTVCTEVVLPIIPGQRGMKGQMMSCHDDMEEKGEHKRRGHMLYDLTRPSAYKMRKERERWPTL